MKPSALSTSKSRARNFDAGQVILERPRICPFRRRVRRSPMGSRIAMCSPLPACFGHAGNLAEIGKVPERDARYFELAVIALRAARQLAAMGHAARRRVAR